MRQIIAGVLILIPVVALAQTKIPVDTQSPVQPAPMAEVYEVPLSEPIVTQDRMAIDTVPELVDAVNEPTAENARRALKAELRRAIYLLEVVRLIEIERGNLMRKVAAQLGVTYPEGTASMQIQRDLMEGKMPFIQFQFLMGIEMGIAMPPSLVQAVEAGIPEAQSKVVAGKLQRTIEQPQPVPTMPSDKTIDLVSLFGKKGK